MVVSLLEGDSPTLKIKPHSERHFKVAEIWLREEGRETMKAARGKKEWIRRGRREGEGGCSAPFLQKGRMYAQGGGGGDTRVREKRVGRT